MSYTRFDNGVSVQSIERGYSAGVFDVTIVDTTASTPRRPVQYEAHACDLTQVEGILAAVEGLTPAHDLQAWCWVIARAKGGEYVVAYDNRSYGTGTLHRWTCSTMPRKFEASNPGDLFDTTLGEFRETAHNNGSGNSYKVCQRCCPTLDEDTLVASSKLARKTKDQRQSAMVSAVARARTEARNQLAQIAPDIEIFLGTGEGKFDLDDQGRVVTTLSMLELIRDALCKEPVA